MKRFLTLLFLIINFDTVAQNSPLFDKIFFSYAQGHNSWGEPGIYSNAEVFELAGFNVKYYKIVKYLKIKYTAGEDGCTFSKDTIFIKRINRPFISRSVVEALYYQLTTNKNNFTAAFIKPQLKSPTKKEILRIATDDSLQYKFENASDIKKSINDIRNFDKLESFINSNKPDPDISKVTIDAWNGLRLYFIKKNDTTVFNQNFLEILGQPLLKLRVNKQFIMKQFVNLDVNTILQSILPGESALRKRVEINNLTGDYIKWYIDKVL